MKRGKNHRPCQALIISAKDLAGVGQPSLTSSADSAAASLSFCPRPSTSTSQKISSCPNPTISFRQMYAQFLKDWGALDSYAAFDADIVMTWL